MALAEVRAILRARNARVPRPILAPPVAVAPREAAVSRRKERCRFAHTKSIVVMNSNGDYFAIARLRGDVRTSQVRLQK
jgi:hypothetical protein